MSEEKHEFTSNEAENAHRQLLDRYNSLEELIQKYPNSDKRNKKILEKLVVTDLFVEKDIMAIEKRANKLQMWAILLYIIAIGFFAFTACLSYINMEETNFFKEVNSINDSIKLWQYFIMTSMQSFTLYGLLILVGVTSWKHSKAKYDQAERLFSKRRQNRQLRLFIHLHDGKIKYKEFLNFLKFSQNENN